MSGLVDLGLAAVTFDCWNTLLYESNWQWAHALRVAALEKAVRCAGSDVPSDEVAEAFDGAWEHHMQLWERGVVSGALNVAQWAMAELGQEPAGAAFDELLFAFEEASHSGNVLAVEGAPATLAALSDAGVRLGLICDTGLTPGRVVRRHLERLDLLAPLEATVFSDELHASKPDPRLFESALATLDSSAARAAHVGDLKRTDVAGARASGMLTVRMRARHDDQSAHVEADFVVDSHRELVGLLLESL